MAPCYVYSGVLSTFQQCCAYCFSVVPHFGPSPTISPCMQATERVNSYVSAQADPEPLSLGMGRLLGVMSDRMHAAAACDSASTPKLSLWCGHDTTLMPLMIMLGNRCQRWPPYASSVVCNLTSPLVAARMLS